MKNTIKMEKIEAIIKEAINSNNHIGYIRGYMDFDEFAAHNAKNGEVETSLIKDYINLRKDIERTEIVDTHFAKGWRDCVEKLGFNA